MKIKLSDHFTYKKLFRFTLPTIIMMLFTSIYSVVDGIFVSNFVGKNALSSINIIYPLAMVVAAFGFMLGTGGSAVVAKTLGEGDRKKANEYFSMIVLSVFLLGLLLSIVCVIFIRPLAYFLGSNDVLINDCITYGTIILLGTFAFMLQTTFHAFFITAEKPKIGLFLTIFAGVSNMLFDYILIYKLNLGIKGAAYATVLGYFIGGIIPLFYFASKNSSLLRFTKPKFYPKILLHSCTNGSSEMVSNISMSIVTFLYNIQMMKYVGESGVAAITIIMYVNFVFIAILIGFSIGSAPIIGFNYGAKNHDELKNMFKKCVSIVVIVSIIMGGIAELLAVPTVRIFIREDGELFNMTLHGFRIFSLAFFICGLNIWGSSFFTALCNGKLSAIISFLRALVLQSGFIVILPMFFGVEGVWWALFLSEIVTLLVTIMFIVLNKNKYKYA